MECKDEEHVIKLQVLENETREAKDVKKRLEKEVGVFNSENEELRIATNEL